MHFQTLALSAFVGLSTAGYTLQDDYMSDGSFFDQFSFYNDHDPTNGFVQYVDQGTAQNNGFIRATSENVYIGADHSNVTPNGRPSVRISSNQAYSAGTMVILDLAHMPGGVCGTWPAFWMLGADWPSNGEIDIIEGVNDQTTNDMTLHTSDGCTITDNGAFTGSIATDNCYIHAAGQPDNAGCGIATSDTRSYGAGFNANNGGVYAMQFTTAYINVYFFPRGSIPADINAGNPSPGGWGKPTAQFQGGCDIPNKIRAQHILFDLTFCGDWAGNVWGNSPQCTQKANTCNDFVANNPHAFDDMYWSINALKVYKQVGAADAAYEQKVNGTSGQEEVKERSFVPDVDFVKKHLRHGKRHGAGLL